MRRALCALVLSVLGISQAVGEFRYEVKRDKLWGGEPGVLTVDEGGIQYRSENGKTALAFAFEDIRKADVSDPRRIRLYTYDRAKKRLTGAQRFKFDLREGPISSALTHVLAVRLHRPVVGSYPVEKTDVEIPAYHRHGLGGCHGVLRFGSAGVAFESEAPKHSRTWRFEDIQTVGTMNAFHFRLTSYAETFNFDLKERLSPEDYRSLWRRVYTNDFQARALRERSAEPARSPVVTENSGRLEWSKGQHRTSKLAIASHARL